MATSVDVQPIIGALVLELVVTVLLYGISTAQAYFYWWSYPNDSNLIKRTVLTIWIVETAHTVFCIHMLYHYTIIEWGNTAGLGTAVWSVGASLLASVIIAAIVQSFFIHRIWILSQHNMVVTCVPAVLLFFRAAFGCANAALAWYVKQFHKFAILKGPRATLACGLSLAALVDLLIAAILTFYLRKHRTSFAHTRQAINSIQVYVVNTGALTMAVSISIILTYAFVNNSMFIGLAEISSKLYANSVLATLNARQGSTSRSSSEPSNAISMSVSGGTQTSDENSRRARPIEIYQSVAKITNDSGSRNSDILDDGATSIIDVKSRKDVMIA